MGILEGNSYLCVNQQKLIPSPYFSIPQSPETVLTRFDYNFKII